MSDFANMAQSKVGLVDRKKIVPYYNLRIAEGCVGMCTYCAIRFSTGALKSKPIDTIIDEFRNGLRQGHDFFQLIAEDTGCYGLDAGMTIIDLLTRIFDIEGGYKLILIDFGPQWLVEYYDELLPLLLKNRGRIKELFIPLQSGSNRVLNAMERPYKIDDVKTGLKDLKVRIPELTLRTTVIIGFPGETEEDFVETKEAIQEIAFSDVQLNKYEDRPGTASSTMKGKVSQHIIDNRYNELETCC